MQIKTKRFQETLMDFVFEKGSSLFMEPIFGAIVSLLTFERTTDFDFFKAQAGDEGCNLSDEDVAFLSCLARLLSSLNGTNFGEDHYDLQYLPEAYAICKIHGIKLPSSN